jgi:uncharacterized protein Yka (UPF0111/DUF47 family)
VAAVFLHPLLEVEILLHHRVQEGLSIFGGTADRLQIEVRRGLFKVEKEMPPVDVMFLYQIINWIGEVADRAQRVGYRLEQLLAR